MPTADVVWGDPTAVLNASIDVRDSLNGLLNSLFYTDPSPVDFTYPYTFDPDPAGECTPHDNTASVVNDAAVLASATATVEVCSGRSGSDLTVTKTATPTFTRTFGWDVKKSVDRHGETIAAGDDATFTYTVDVTKGDRRGLRLGDHRRDHREQPERAGTSTRTWPTARELLARANERDGPRERIGRGRLLVLVSRRRAG